MTYLRFSPDFCEVLYAHYGDRIRDCNDEGVKEFLIRGQNFYLEMHERLVPISDLTIGIPSISQSTGSI